MDTSHKAAILAHCLWMAESDPQYAIWAAGWYEKTEPVLLKNLQAKVQQEIRRKQSPTARATPAEGTTA